MIIWLIDFKKHINDLKTRLRNRRAVYRYRISSLLIYSDVSVLFSVTLIYVLLRALYSNKIESYKSYTKFLLSSAIITFLAFCAIAIFAKKLVSNRAYKRIKEYQSGPVDLCRNKEDILEWLVAPIICHKKINSLLADKKISNDKIMLDSENTRGFYLEYINCYTGSQSVNTFIFTALFLAIMLSIITFSLDENLKLSNTPGFIKGTNLLVSIVIAGTLTILIVSAITAGIARAITSKYYGYNHMVVQVYNAHNKGENSVRSEFKKFLQNAQSHRTQHPEIKIRSRNLHVYHAHAAAAISVFLSLAGIFTFVALHDSIMCNNTTRLSVSSGYIFFSIISLLFTSHRFFERRICDASFRYSNSDLESKNSLINGETAAMFLSAATLLSIGISGIFPDEALYKFMKMPINGTQMTIGQLSLLGVAVIAVLAITLPICYHLIETMQHTMCGCIKGSNTTHYVRRHQRFKHFESSSPDDSNPNHDIYSISTKDLTTRTSGISNSHTIA